MNQDILSMSQGNEPSYHDRIAAIQNATREEILQCIADPNCKSWFLHDVFRNRHDNDDIMIKSILEHMQCPPRLLIITRRIKPEWMKDSPVIQSIEKLPPDDERRIELRSFMVLFSLSPLEDFLTDTFYSQDLRNRSQPKRANNGERLPTDLSWDRDECMKELLRRTPNFILEHYLTDKESQDTLATWLDWNLLSPNLPNFDARYRALAASRNDIPADQTLALSRDNSAVVRRALAANTKVDESIRMTLTQDSNTKVAEEAAKHLSETARAQLLQQSHGKSKTGSNNTADDRDLLMILRLPTVETSELSRIAASAPPLFACAATLHASADTDVCAALIQRNDIPQWAYIGAALISDDASFVNEMLSTKDAHLQIALADNPHLSDTQAEALLAASKSDRCLANLANTKINNIEFLERITAGAKDAPAWVTALKMALDPKTGATDLKSIYSTSEFRYLVHSRLIARHPNCPKDLHRKFVVYLPDDLALNPSYALQVLEAGKPVAAKPFDRWKINEYLDNGDGHEFIYRWVIEHEEWSDARKTISASRVNPNWVRRFVVLDDTHAYRRFLHENAVEYSEYEYRMIARIAGAGVKKNLIERSRLSNDLLLELTADKDKAVAMSAQTMAQKRNLKVAVEIDKSGIKGLGNKMARLDLASATHDLEILQMLAEDPTKDVRAAVAYREELDLPSLLKLLQDKESIVVSRSLSNLRRRKLENSDFEQMQSILKSLIASSTYDEYLRRSAFEFISDAVFVDSQYQGGEGIFDNLILEKTNNQTIIDDAISKLSEGKKKISGHALAKNPNTTKSQLDRLIKLEPRTVSSAIEYANSADELIHIYQNHKTVISQYKLHSRLRCRAEFNASEIEQLYACLPADDFLNFAGSQSYKLTDEALIPIIERLHTNNEFYNIVIAKDLPNASTRYLFDVLLKMKNDSLLGTFISGNKIDSGDIDLLMKNATEYLRCAIARHQMINDFQLEKLCNDRSMEVREAIFYSEFIDKDKLSATFLKSLQGSTDQYILEEVRKRLQAKGEASAHGEQLPATLILKKFGVPLSAAKFNKILQENGFIEISKRESHTKPGEYRESKKLSSKGEIYGRNDEDGYGDYKIYYFTSEFDALLKANGLLT